jgi:hypothetical protein
MIVHLPTDPLFLGILRRGSQIAIGHRPTSVRGEWTLTRGADSRFALSPDEVIDRSRPRDADKASGHAHFQLASQLEMDGHHAAAVQHFREAHRLVPDSWTFRRQAWSLEKVGNDAMARFWQGPDPKSPEAWPYEGDWLTDVRKIGAENYNDPWRP